MRLVERVGVLSKATTRLVRRQLATRTDRPFQQLRALRAIQRSAEPCTQAALADQLLIDAAAASRLVDRLVDEGLVRRGECADRRCVGLALTRAATRELAIVDAALQTVEDELVALLGKREAHRLADAIGQLADALVTEPAPAPARYRRSGRR